MVRSTLSQEDIFMARRRNLSPERKEFINGLLEHYQPSDVHDIQEMLKDLLGDTLQGMLEAEMDESAIVFYHSCILAHSSCTT